jgi:hypothetical protein
VMNEFRSATSFEILKRMCDRQLDFRDNPETPAAFCEANLSDQWFIGTARLVFSFRNSRNIMAPTLNEQATCRGMALARSPMTLMVCH